jgi:hypothetical protein
VDSPAASGLGAPGTCTVPESGVSHPSSATTSPARTAMETPAQRVHLFAPAAVRVA